MTAEKGRPAGRRSPFSRVIGPSPVVLQPRDEAILEAVYGYSLLTGEQIQELAGFGCTPRRNVRLRTLFDHQYLDRQFLPTLQGSARPVYLLGPKGVDVITRRLGVDPQQVKRQMRAARETKDLFLLHRLQVNHVRFAFAAAMERHPEMTLQLWKDGPDLKEVGLIPDGYCRYAYHDRPWSFFLELDRSTESHRRVRAKVEAYLKYGLSGLYQHHFHLKFFRVLVITLSPERLANLKRLVEGITDKIFWLAALNDLGRETVFGEIWQRPRKEGRFALHED